MTKTIVIAFCLLCGSAFAEGTSEWQSYAAELQRYCPTKHLELLSPTAFSRIAGRYLKNADHQDRGLLDRAWQREGRDCADISCRNAAFLRAAESINGIAGFATTVCDRRLECVGPADCQTVSMQQIKDRMEQTLAARGPKATLREYFDCEVGDGYAAVETGDPRTINVALRVREVSDACVSEGIESALGTAMQHAPEAVLPHVERLGTGICGPWLIEASRAETLASLALSEKALRRVTRKDLLAARDKCLADIVRSRDEVRRSPGP